MKSKRINLYDEYKIQKVNPETMDILKRYKVDMCMRNLSPATITAYETDLKAWFIYVLDNQENKSVRNLTDDDITEFLYLCKCEGNNSERIRRRLSSIGAFYKFMRKKKLIVENPTEFIDRPKHGVHITMQTFLTPEQVALMRERLISADDLQLRTYAMLSLSTMGRVSAIARIKSNKMSPRKRRKDS